MRFAALALLVSQLLGAAAPTVTKVEPPNWWAGHSLNPIRLLIRGTSLQNARVTVSTPGFRATEIRINDNGTYLFADITIPRQVRPGPVKLSLTTTEGTAPVPFEISAPLVRTGRFQGFSPDDLIYLIMPDRFADGDPSNNDPAISKGLYDKSKPRYYHGGDLQGIIDHLPYLKDLGITAIWLNPIYDNVNHLNTRETYGGQPITDYHGYGAVDFYGVEEHFGTLDKFRELVDKAHAAGIKIIQDQVANHTGPFHPWVTDSPTSTWYNGTLANHLANTWQTWTLMDPHSPPAMRKATLEGWFIDILPDLNQNDPEVARYLIQNALWWIGISGIDGIRQDTWPYVPRNFWHDWMAAIKREYPNFRVVGEVFDSDPGLVSFFQGGAKRFDGIDDGVDSVFDFPLLTQLRRAFANGGSVRDVASMLGHDHLYTNPDMLVTFLGLHDMQRFMNEKGATAAGLKLAFTFLMTTRGVPMIYYGDELAMPGGNDPDNRRDFPARAFTAEGRTPEEQGLISYVSRMAHLRAANDCLRRGSLADLIANDQVYAYTRAGRSCTAVIAINNAATQSQLAMPVRFPDGVIKDELGIADAQSSGSALTVTLPPRSASVYLAPAH